MKQLTLDWGRDGSGAMKPRATIAGRSRTAARTERRVRTIASIRLEDALERTNLQRALRRIEHNGGAPGIDGTQTWAASEWQRPAQQSACG